MILVLYRFSGARPETVGKYSKHDRLLKCSNLWVTIPVAENTRLTIASQFNV